MGEPNDHPADFRARVLGGMFWSVLAALFVKALSLTGQLAAPSYLDPSDFGRAAMAISIANLLLFLAPGNFGPILVRERRDFATLAGEVFWLSLAASVLGALTLAAIALALVRLERSAVAILLLMLAAALPLQALSTIYAAKLSRDMSFRAMSLINMGAGLLTTATMLALAISGWGAHALVIPLLFAAVYSALAYRIAAGRVSIPPPHPGSWGPNLRSVLWVVAFSGSNAMYTFAPQLLIGAQFGSTPAGLFYWAWLISSQLVTLVGASIQAVMFPTLARLEGDQEQRQHLFGIGYGFFLACGGAIALIQSLAGETVVTSLFEARWHAASPIILVFSMAVMSQLAHAIVVSQLLAEGEFRRLALLTLGSAILVILSMLLSALIGASLVTVAASAAAAWGVTHLLAGGWVAARLHVPVRAHWRTVGLIYASAAGAYAVAHAAESVSGEPSTVQAIAQSAIALLVYGALVMSLLRSEARQWARAARRA